MRVVKPPALLSVVLVVVICLVLVNMTGVSTTRASPPPWRRVRVAPTAAAVAAAIFAAALVLASLPTVGQALNFDLPPGQEECFYEEVHAGTLYGGEGGAGKSGVVGWWGRVGCEDCLRTYDGGRAWAMRAGAAGGRIGRVACAEPPPSRRSWQLLWDAVRSARQYWAVPCC